jgi:hypothetical protein
MTKDINAPRDDGIKTRISGKMDNERAHNGSHLYRNIIINSLQREEKFLFAGD